MKGSRLVRTPLATDPTRLTTPDGDVLTTVSGPSGELLAAWRASGADQVIAATSLVPDSAVLRLALPTLSALLRIRFVNRLSTGALARVSTRARERTRASWAHARAEWASGEVREAWLRVGDGSDFTAAVTAEVARRLRNGEGRPGAHTPGALFGPELAEAAGASIADDTQRSHIV